MVLAEYKCLLPKPLKQIDGYKFWVNGKGYNNFNTFRVYWAYRWFIAKQVDEHNSTTPIKKQWGSVIEKTNYTDRYAN